jgi:hypothetical protein
VSTRLNGNKPRIWKADKDSVAKFKVNQVRVGHDNAGKYYMVDVVAPMAAIAGREGTTIIEERFKQ